MSRPRSLLGEDSAARTVLSRAECEALAHRVLAYTKADETRVTINSAARANTRFAANQISTSGDDTTTTVTVRSRFGTRSASVTINALDEASLAGLVRDAEALARLSPEDPESMPELGPQTYPASRTQSLTLPSPADRAAAVQAVTKRAIAAGCASTGYIEARLNAVAVANSRGLFGYDQTGGASMTTTVRTPDGTGSGWAGANGMSWGEIDPSALAQSATEKATRSRHPVAIEPGRYTVILEPTAVGNLVQLITLAGQARAADEGRSFFSRPGGGNKIGSKVADERVTLVSDPADLGATFDAEGLPLKPVTWIERGIVKQLYYDRYWAKKQGVAPTPAVAAGFGTNSALRLMGGTTTVPEMIASTERGILVTRFWYIRPVDPRTILYTGLTRDGTFLIEEGRITQAIKNLRYNESPIFMLNRLDAIGPTVRVSASEDGGAGSAIIMPPIKCHDFTFTSLSDAV